MAKTSSGFDLDILKKQAEAATTEQLQKSLANVDKFAKGDQQVKDFYTQQLAARGVQTQQTPQTPAQTPESIIQQIQQQKIEKAKQAMLAGIQAQREQSQAASQAERQALQQSAMQQRGRIGVEDVMSRRARENVLAQGGLAASGARGQGEIAQNVITQGALGQNRAQEQQGLLDIGRRQSEYEARLNQQALEAQTQAELQGLDYRLQDLYSQQQAEREQAALESERAFTLSRDEADRQFTLARDEAQNLNQQQRDLLQADIQREQTLLDAEIQRARDMNNFELEKQLMRQKQANDIQLEGIRTANDIRLEGVKQKNRLDLEGGTTKPTFDIKTWKTSLDRLEKGSVDRGTFGEETPNENKRQLSLSEEIMSNVLSGRMTEDQAAQLIVEYGIDEKYLELAENALTGNLPLNPRR